MAKKRSRKRKHNPDAPGWVWMLFGLSLGLVIAAGVYFSGASAPPEPVQQRAAARVGTSQEPAAVEPETTEPAHPATRFDFYEMLPKFEVVIPEVENNVRPDRRATAVAEPGNYVLQAGSFTSVDDAERMRANLALLGIESRIQRVAIDDDIFHRVRIGPTDDLDELNAIRRRLWDAEIEVLLIEIPN